MSQHQARKRCLAEVSWEVCNKVGGINTVLATKAKYALQNFPDRYLAIGPWLDRNDSFVEQMLPLLEPISKVLYEKNIRCRYGYWDTPQCPPIPTILVEYKNRYKIDDLLYRLWSHFEVDSLASNFEYIEPILFSTAAGEIIKTIGEDVLIEEQLIAHFHEWLCGAGSLYIQQYAPQIVTVFTTHATVLGRALAGAHQDIYHLPAHFSPNLEANKQGVFAKHSMESATAKFSDCFTTVSRITAEESLNMLGKYPEKIVFNGMDMQRIQHASPDKINSNRKKLIDIAEKITRKPISDHALLFMTSGRYEPHNKGFDLFLKSLALLEKDLNEDSPPIVALFLIGSGYRTKHDSLLDETIALDGRQKEAIGIATHRINNPYDDPIIRLCNEYNLRYSNKIHVVFSDAYLNGSDGVFDILYEEALEACDLSVFPSAYEPWGYTPLESITYGTPTITSDVAGFGCWVYDLREDYQGAVYVLPRKDKTDKEATDQLCDYLKTILKQSRSEREIFRSKARQIAQLADWKYFYNDYLDAYDQACEFNEIIHHPLSSTYLTNSFTTNIHGEESFTPKLRTFEHESQLPKALEELRPLVNNFWWSWNDEVACLLQELDARLWEKSKHNPVYFLNFASNLMLMKKANDPHYISNYLHILSRFHSYMGNRVPHKMCDTSIFNAEHPIAYFCLEYALDECLSIYSGGLGVLAGDYLKTLSDLNIPTIAIGLFYKQGYFIQKINAQGDQVAFYDSKNPNQLPMHQLNDENGKPLMINLEILERTVHLCVWEVKVGHVNLYLFDTDIPENTPEDRLITSKLYVGTPENRFIQELILGIGGVRLITHYLKVKPALYHLNEGHSVFLLLERIRALCNEGFSHIEAAWIVYTSSIFTTHTSVPAGNEVYEKALIRKYGEKPMERLKIPLDELLRLGQSNVSPNKFSLTALALRLACGSNAVSKIHRQVVCSMWKDIWKGFLQDELPTTYVTNGVHLPTWLGPDLKKLFHSSLKDNWMDQIEDPTIWKDIYSIPDESLWEAHQTQKEKLLASIRSRILSEYTARNERKRLIKSSLDALKKNSLLICLSRRFATYKRHDLILKNRERLAKLLVDEKKPVILVIAGKAHPADGVGNEKIHLFIEAIRDELFQGHIIFLEDYDLVLAKSLVQGADVWLNNPIRYSEACGTSGMKAGMNGVLNLSTRDGWWDEAYSPDIGWTIESIDTHGDESKRDEIESMFLLDILETSVIPTYFNVQQGEINSHWVAMMKASIATLSYQFNTVRMAQDYFERLYNPVGAYAKHLIENNYVKLKELTEWKKDIANRFTTVQIKTILVDGIKDGKIHSDGIIHIKLLLFSGKVKANELKVEFVLIKNDENQSTMPPTVIPLTLEDSRDSGILTYSTKYHLIETGFYSYGIRLLPVHPLLIHPQDSEVVIWG